MRAAFRERAARFDVVGLGEISVDEVLLLGATPAWGGKVRAGRRERLGGGQVATAMVACRRLGLDAAFIGVVGDDEDGRFAVDELRRENVDTEGVRTASGNTHAAVVLIDAAGQRTVIWHRDERIRVEAVDVNVGWVTAGRVLHLDGHFPEASAQAARLARAAGCLVSCDLDECEPATLELLPLVDVCVVSEAFIAGLPSEGVEPAASLRSVGSTEAAAEAADVSVGLGRLASRIAPGGLCCVTLGERGAAACVSPSHRAGVEESGPVSPPLFPGTTPGVVVEVPAFRGPGLRTLDTTACGDTFRAGLLSGLFDRLELHECLRRAAGAAALKTLDLGRRGCPTREELSAFLRVQGDSFHVERRAAQVFRGPDGDL